MKKMALIRYGSIAALLLIVLGVVYASGHRYLLNRNYEVFANVECNPVSEHCFVGDGENSPSAYKEIHAKAYTIPTCNEWAGQCNALECAANSDSCTVLYCDPEEEECAVP